MRGYLVKREGLEEEERWRGVREERERERMMLLVFLLRSHDSLRSVLTALGVAGGRLHRHTSA